MKDYTFSPQLPTSDDSNADQTTTKGAVTNQKKGSAPVPTAAPAPAPAPAPVTAVDEDEDEDDLETLKALLLKQQKIKERADLKAQLAALTEENRLTQKALELTKIELKNETDSKIEQLRAESKQRIAAMTVSAAGTLSDDDIQMIRSKQDQVASDSKQAFLGKFSVVKDLNDQRIKAEDTKLRSELQVEIDRIKDATPRLALSGTPQSETPQSGDTVTLKSAADQTIEATVI
jgi:hypothetical protein